MMTTYGMMLNTDLFQERGVELPTDGMWTYEEFVEKLQTLTYDAKGRGKTTHFGFNSFIYPQYYNIWGIILSDGAEIFNDKMEYTFNDERAKSGVQKVIDIYFILKGIIIISLIIGLVFVYNGFYSGELRLVVVIFYILMSTLSSVTTVERIRKGNDAKSYIFSAISFLILAYISFHLY